ncbi:hypothetical protein M8818_002807 [Zalaria obscura]|uniref:Uncharacterized protein n=1 Tax=Zalaria obscura TaxID=2024903 RepID=A0ACC3SHY8_9PEZI
MSSFVAVSAATNMDYRGCAGCRKSTPRVSEISRARSLSSLRTGGWPARVTWGAHGAKTVKSRTARKQYERHRLLDSRVIARRWMCNDSVFNKVLVSLPPNVPSPLWCYLCMLPSVYRTTVSFELS